MDDGMSMNLFFHSLDSWLRLLLRLVKVLLEYGLSGHAAESVGLAGLGTNRMVLSFFCDFVLRVGYVERPETYGDIGIGLVILSGLGSRRTFPVGVDGATMAQRAPFPASSIPAYIE